VDDVTVIVSVDVPELLIDAGLNEKVMPVAGGETVAFKNTVPLKPPSAVTVIVHVPVLVPDVGWMIVTDEHAVTVKSWTLTVTIAVCDKAPFVPVTVTV